MNKIKQIENKIREVCPELMELSKGCQFEWCNEEMEQVLHEVAWIAGTQNVLTDTHGFTMYAFTKGVGKNNDPYPEWHSFDHPEDYKDEEGNFFDYATIIGHPIQLNHLLRAMAQAPQTTKIVMDLYGVFWDMNTVQASVLSEKPFHYDLSKSVHQNLEENPELKEFCYQILIEE